MTNLSPSVIPPRMGRPPIKRDAKVKKTTVWLHEDMVARIVAMVGSQGMSAFFRDAAEAELKRRERAKKND